MLKLPRGSKPLKQRQVTKAMTAYAIAILKDVENYPLGSVVQLDSATDSAIYARVEWHSIQARTGKLGRFRGVTLYRAPEASEDAS
jgi:3-phenylpropionate/cinnamic acid dioxygenase small subunit